MDRLSLFFYFLIVFGGILCLTSLISLLFLRWGQILGEELEEETDRSLAQIPCIDFFSRSPRER